MQVLVYSSHQYRVANDLAALTNSPDMGSQVQKFYAQLQCEIRRDVSVENLTDMQIVIQLLYICSELAKIIFRNCRSRQCLEVLFYSFYSLKMRNDLKKMVHRL